MVNLNIQLPEGFLNEEVRCGYVVTHEMKKAWAVMLDLLAEFDRVCKKNNIKYYANGGTMLGAVRHKGFIPWDDDIDVMMFREDYDRLMEIGPKEFSYPYFFQNKYTDPESNDFMSKLRNSETLAIFDTEKKTFLKYNKGIFIDIFPIDNVPDNEVEREAFHRNLSLLREKIFSYGRSIGIFSDSAHFIEHVVKKCLYYLLKARRKNKQDVYLRMIQEYDVLCSKYKYEKTKFSTTYVFGPFEKLFKYNSDLSDSVEMDFEFMKIPVCAGYDHYLKHEFGDYMKYVKGTSMHSDIFFVTDCQKMKDDTDR